MITTLSIMNYNDFKNACEALGKKNEISVSVKYYDMKDYGREDWYQATFEVDSFGGIAAIISYYEGNLWYESSTIGKRIFTRWSEVEEWLPGDKMEEEAARGNICEEISFWAD